MLKFENFNLKISKLPYISKFGAFGSLLAPGCSVWPSNWKLQIVGYNYSVQRLIDLVIDSVA